MRLSPLLVLVAAGVACAHAPAPVPAAAPALRAYAGRVAVEYEPQDGAVAAQVVRALRTAVPAAERWGALRSVTIRVHPTHEALEAAARRAGYAWLRAWARRDSIELQSPRTWSRGAARDEELAQLLAHELTHCVMYQAAGAQGATIPLWFREGMATTSAGEQIAPVHPARAGVTLAAAASTYASDPDLAYGAADTAFRALLARAGEEPVRRLLHRVGDGTPFAAAFALVMGISVEAFEHELEAAAHG